MKILGSEQVEFYKHEGYLHASDVVTDDALGLAETVLRDWSERQIGEWLYRGLLDDSQTVLAFSQRLAVYDLLVESLLLDLVADLLGTDEISVHGIFNARPKLPEQRWTDTPWHEYAQYYRDAERVHVGSIWFPLQAVREESSCLQVAPQRHKGVLFDNWHDEDTGSTGIDRAEWSDLEAVSVPMDRGDALCFTQLTPHRALRNTSDVVRWSMDLRYEATETATDGGKQYGFVA